MTVGGILMRTVLSAAFVAVTFAVERMLFRIRARRAHLLRVEKATYQSHLDEALRAIGETRLTAPEHKSTKSFAMHRAYRSLTPEEQQARKDWARARLMRHPRIPSWKNDSEYLLLILESARGGCTEAMNKLSEYAYRKKAYVEAYYWTLRLELAGARVMGRQPSVILREWLKHDTAGKHHRSHEGFYDDQYRFARSVMRIRSGKDKERGLQRLQLLARNGDPDAVRYVEKNGLETSPGERPDGGEKLR